MKILIIQSSSLGKVVMSTPVIRLLKTQLEAEVHVASDSEYIQVLENNPYLDEIHSTSNSAITSSNSLKHQGFDLIIDLDNSIKSFLTRVFLKGKKIIHRHKRIKKWWSLKLRLNHHPERHLTDRYIETLASLGVKPDNLGLDFFISDRNHVERNWLPKTHQNGYAVFILDATKKTKQLPIKRMIELCDRINKPIILLGGNWVNKLAVEIEQFFRRGSEQEEKEIESLNKKTAIFNACGKFNLNQTASIIDQANWVFTHDNDLMHVAAALNKQTFSIWGSSTANFGEYPYRTKFTIFENTKIKCRPCSFRGYDKCPKGHFKCMNDLTFDFYLPD
ncbi:MAG: glycosyltransferase family 9 protein [Bacteroidota bacterium]